MTRPTRHAATPDAADCAREPIHLSGAIQPHGFLVSCVLPDWTVRHASANVAALLEVEADALVGQSLREYVADEVLQAVTDAIDVANAANPAQRVGAYNIGTFGQLCELGVHAADGLVHVEVEPQAGRQAEQVPTGIAQAMIARIAAAEDEGDFHQRVAEQVRQLTGYHRVMVYRFRPDDAGEVIAEARAAHLEPYLGLRYPASDIPEQARRLYLHNRLRVIPDAGYSPVPIVPPLRADGGALDLSRHVLRSVSPVHLEYLRNMGVAASMSISIVSGGRLWGLIACHHDAPRAVPPAVRAAAELFGLFVSMRVSARDQDATVAHYEHAQRLRDAMAARLSQAADFADALTAELPLLSPAIDSCGAMLLIDGECRSSGRVPDPGQLPALRRWLATAGASPLLMSADAVDWREAGAADGLAGIMAVHLGSGDDWLLLFRGEQVEDVRWAGEPRKALVTSDDGLRIAPRKSFATWRETVRGRSEPWSEGDRRGAERLHRVLHEQRRRSLAQAQQLRVLEAEAQRQALRDQKQRLGDVASLMEGLVHLDADATRRLGSRIARLEADLRRAMRAAHPAMDDAGGPSGSAMTN